MWLERSVWLFMCVRVKEQKKTVWSTVWLTSRDCAICIFLSGTREFFITLPQYRFSSLTFLLSFSYSKPCHMYFIHWILPTYQHHPQTFSLLLFLFSEWFILKAHVSLVTLTQREMLRKVPTKHSPAQILCLSKEHSSRPWQQASLFTYPVCRHMIAMTTSWLPCQFSDAIVLFFYSSTSNLMSCVDNFFSPFPASLF